MHYMKTDTQQPTPEPNPISLISKIYEGEKNAEEKIAQAQKKAEAIRHEAHQEARELLQNAHTITEEDLEKYLGVAKETIKTIHEQTKQQIARAIADIQSIAPAIQDSATNRIIERVLQKHNIACDH